MHGVFLKDIEGVLVDHLQFEDLVIWIKWVRNSMYVDLFGVSNCFSRKLDFILEIGTHLSNSVSFSARRIPSMLISSLKISLIVRPCNIFKI